MACNLFSATHIEWITLPMLFRGIQEQGSEVQHRLQGSLRPVAALAPNKFLQPQVLPSGGFGDELSRRTAIGN